MKRSVLLFVILFALGASARKEYAPLPPEIVSAKSVFIDNQSKHANVSDAAYKELNKWKRFTISPRRDDADLVFLFTYGTEKTAQTADGTVTGNNVDVDISPAEICQVTLFILSKDKSVLWSNTKRCSRRGAANDLVIDLRNRMSN